MNIFEKIARRLTRRSWNRTVHLVILRSMKRGVIDSHQAHAILGAWNRECFPEEGHAAYFEAVEHNMQADAKANHSETTIEGEEIAEEQWKERYIAYIMKHSNAEHWQAEESAGAAWDYVVSYGGDETPEESAQNELDCWE